MRRQQIMTFVLRDKGDKVPPTLKIINIGQVSMYPSDRSLAKSIYKSRRNCFDPAELEAGE